MVYSLHCTTPSEESVYTGMYLCIHLHSRRTYHDNVFLIHMQDYKALVQGGKTVMSWFNVACSLALMNCSQTLHAVPHKLSGQCMYCM